jgi:hypothetical protein
MKAYFRLPVTAMLAACLLLWASGQARANVLDVPSSFSSIQAAIDAAAEGDTVLVEAGVYHERLLLNHFSIIVESVQGPDETVIDADHQGPVVVFDGNSSTLRGFKLTNGSGVASPYIKGGGIVLYWANPVIENCIIENNQGDQGGGIAAIGGGTIRNCKIVGNEAEYEGGGVFGLSFGDPLVFTNTLIAGNRCVKGAGIHGAAILINCSIINNDLGEGLADASGSILTNTIVYGNEKPEISGSPASVTYCNVQGGYAPGEGNIDEDPLFQDGDGEYHLSENSPCVDRGLLVQEPTVDLDGEVRPFGAGFDIGADEFVPVEDPVSNEAPRALGGGPYEGKTGTPIEFNACTSGDPDGQIVLYQWDWDDDGTCDEHAESCVIAHTWAAAFQGTVRLRVTDEGGLTAEDRVEVKVVSPGGVRDLCASLGDNRHRWSPDSDAFSFKGEKGERVTIKLKANRSIHQSGDRAILMLTDKIRTVRFLRTSCGALPRSIKAVLPKTGTYEIVVVEYPQWRRWGPQRRFTGTYCVTLESSKDAWKTFETSGSVE